MNSHNFLDTLYRIGIYYIHVIIVVFFSFLLALSLNLSRFYSRYSNVKDRQICDLAFIKMSFPLIDFVAIVFLMIEIFRFYVPNPLGIVIILCLQLIPLLLHTFIMKKTRFRYMDDRLTTRVLAALWMIIFVDTFLQILFQVGVNFLIPTQLLANVVTVLMFTPICLLIVVSRRMVYIV